MLVSVLVALACPALTCAQNTLVWKTNYYAIAGASIGELRRSMSQSRTFQGPSNLVGLTEWRIDWRYKVNPSATGCRCSSFTTTTVITNTLPRWIAPASAPDDLKANWTRYITALGQHEDGHSQIALAGLAEMHKRIKELGESADCTTMTKRINDTAWQVVNEQRERDREYDRRTHHGGTQGVSFR